MKLGRSTPERVALGVQQKIVVGKRRMTMGPGRRDGIPGTKKRSRKRMGGAIGKGAPSPSRRGVEGRERFYPR